MMRSSQQRTAEPSVHPNADQMADFVAGQMHPYRRWIVEAHLEFCATCRGLAARGSRLGGAWLDSLGASTVADSKAVADSTTAADRSKAPKSGNGEGNGAVSTKAPDVWSRLEARVLVEASLSRQPAWPEMPLPESVRREIETAAMSPEWLSVGESSSRVVRVAFDAQEELEFFLVRTPAGGTFPRHRHVHGEDLLILSGSLHDDYGSLRPGDVWHYPSGSSHEPEVGTEEECFAISCVRGGLVFEA